MDALTDNFLANMRGPDFLVLYAIFAFLIILGFVFLTGLESEKDDRPLPPVPARPDPYELAFIREGPAGVVWLAIYTLRRAGLVELTKGRIHPVAGGRTPSDPYESAVWRAVGSGCAPSQIIRGRAPGGSLASLISSLESRLAKRGLVRDPSYRQRVLRIAVWAGGALVLLALYKGAIATAHGHRNIGGLFIECAFALVVLVIMATRFRQRRASQRGLDYLDRAKMVFGRAPPDTDNAAGDNGSLAALLVALYGFQILAGGPEAAFAQQARAARSSGGCGGSGCSGGGGGCSGGGGCGGCGGT